MGRKWIRILVGIVFLVLLGVTFIPKLYLENSSDGVVNARTLTVRSPIEGTVRYKDNLHHGQFFRKGELIGEVVNDRLDSNFLYELSTEKMTLESRVEIMKKRLESYRALSRELKENLRKYQDFSRKQYEMQISQAEAQIKREQAEYDRAKLSYDANRNLYEKDAIRRRDVETSQAQMLQSEASLLELNNRKNELTNRLNAVLSGVFLGDGNNDVPYSNQRMDQLVIEIALADAALTESVERLKGIGKQMEIEQERLERVRRYPITAPFDCLVWRIPAGNLSSAAINSELVVLMDCGTIFLDVSTPESLFSQTPRGEKARFRLRGEEDFHTGVVTARRGSGTQGQMYELAAVPVHDPLRDFRLWIEVEPKDLDLTVENFYRVGQRVEVKINKNINPWHDIVRFFNVF